MKTIQKTAIALAATGLFATAAFAADTPTNPEDAGSPISANVTVVNDYRYRGISQSNFKPAIQGGFDYAHESGLYIGNWNSSISWIADGYNTASAQAVTGKQVSSQIEMDFYAGFKKELIGAGYASDFGVLQYYYPTSASVAGFTNPNTTEIYAAQNATFGPVTGFLKFSYALSNTFGWYGSTGSNYLDLTANYDTGFYGITLNAHAGYQKIAGQYYEAGMPSRSYADWKLGLTKDFGGGLSASAAYVATNQKQGSGAYAGTYANYVPGGRNMGAATGLVSLTKTF